MTNSASCPERLPQYGGQALIEGVMMRGKYAAAVAMRAPDGQIVIHTEPLSGIYKNKWIKLPFIRGAIALWDALGLGMRFLTMSANLQAGEEEKIEGKSMVLTMAASLLIAAGLFFAAPAFLGHLTERYLGFSHLAGNMVEGLIKLVFVIGYIWGVGRIPEIRRVFAYHGAEHKTINAYEARADLTPENVLRYSLEHPRCGTAFLLTLVVISILFFAALGPMSGLVRVVTRIVFLPVLAGIAYEYIRWTARHLDNPLIRLLVKPNLALQRLTTNEPDAPIAEVAIAAFNAMLAQGQIMEEAQSKQTGEPVRAMEGIAKAS